MDNRMSFISRQVQVEKLNSSLAECLICGNKNEANKEVCSKCGYSLSIDHSLLFSRYNLFNKALEAAKNESYVESLEKNSVFLDYFPSELNSKRLQIFLKYKLEPNNLNKIIQDNYPDMKRDRWFCDFEDNPQLATIDSIIAVSPYTNNESKLSSFDMLFHVLSKKRQNIRNSIALINGIFDYYYAVKRTSDERLIKQFELFFKNTFLLFMSRQEISVKDYTNEIINDTNISLVEIVDTKYTNSTTHNYVVDTIQPEIKYHSTLLQKAKVIIALKETGNE